MPCTVNLVITYDIEDNKRRTKVHKTLLNFGAWVQFSVFECDLAEKDLVRLRHELTKLVDLKADSVHFYALCDKCHRKLERLGVHKGTLDMQDLIV